MQRWFALIAAFLIAGCSTVGPADAQGMPGGTEPPLIAGRVALADGDARIWRVEEDSAGEWDDAMVNDVVSAGTGLYTGDDGRSEVRVGPHTFRLAAAGRGGFTQLDYAAGVFNLEYGTLNVRLASPDHGETTAVTAAGVRVDLAAPGRYRIDVTDRGPLRLTVFEGHGTVRPRGSPVGVGPGQAIVVGPGGNGFEYEAPVATAFDQWALGRDAQYRQVRSAQYVSPYMTGYEALDTYGDWTNDATYGVVWYPRAVPAGWAPYRHGQWRWVRPWGWTWVDYAPWGYAPFHYGRWVMIGPRWCWVPGGYVQRPVWAPALVGFVGSGVSVSVSIGSPVVGWYPLAPWHRYEPHYRHSPTYVTIINQTVINRPPPGVPRNLTQGPGATLVPGPRFREPIQRVALPGTPKLQELKPIAPPPLNVAPAPRSKTPRYSDRDAPGAAPMPPAAREQPDSARPQPDSMRPSVPGRPDLPPGRVRPPLAAEPTPGRGVAPQTPLPGNEPAPLAQPPRLKRDLPAPSAPAPASPAPERPTPRPHLPSDQLPPGRQPVNPAEPPRFPPGAPPTLRQPQAAVPAGRAEPPPAARGLAGRAPQAQPAPAPVAPPAAVQSAPPGRAAAPDRPAPPAAAPSPRAEPDKAELRGQGQARGKSEEREREAPPMRPKQADR